MNTVAVLFHGPSCNDGFTAAWAAWTVMGDNADYIPVNYGDKVPDVSSYTDLYIVDFSYPAATLLELAVGRRVVVLDHHRTAEQDLKDLNLPNEGMIKFDMNKSGAVLAWEFFHPKIALPKISEYVQDRDLWQWKLSHSKEVSAALDLTERTFAGWSEFNQQLLDDDGYNNIIVTGSAILKFINQKVDLACKKARLGVLAGHEVPIVNSAIWQSEIGEKLCGNYPFAAVFYINTDGKYVYSLRSRSEFDVSAVAKNFPGGGGHKNAAGFVTDRLQ